MSMTTKILLTVSVTSVSLVAAACGSGGSSSVYVGVGVASPWGYGYPYPVVGGGVVMGVPGGYYPGVIPEEDLDGAAMRVLSDSLASVADLEAGKPRHCDSELARSNECSAVVGPPQVAER